MSESKKVELKKYNHIEVCNLLGLMPRVQRYVKAVHSKQVLTEVKWKTLLIENKAIDTK